MAKKTSDPTQDRIDALREVGITIAPMKTHPGFWKVTIGDSSAPHPMTAFSGYPDQIGAIVAAESLTTNYRRFRRDTDRARAELEKATGYTHVTPERMRTFERALVAAKEYERIEARRLGLSIRG